MNANAFRDRIFVGFSEDTIDFSGLDRFRFNNTKMGKFFPRQKLIRLIDTSTRRKEISLDERSWGALRNNLTWQFLGEY